MGEVTSNVVLSRDRPGKPCLLQPLVDLDVVTLVAGLSANDELFCVETREGGDRVAVTRFDDGKTLLRQG